MKKCKIKVANSNMYFWQMYDNCYMYSYDPNSAEVFNSIKAAKDFIREHKTLCKANPERFSFKKLTVEVLQ